MCASLRTTVVLVVLLSVYFVWVQASQGFTIYNMLDGLYITSPILSTVPCDKFCKRTCVSACGCEPSCKSISVNQQQQQCRLHQNTINDDDTEYSNSSDWQYHQIRTGKFATLYVHVRASFHETILG